MNYSTAVFLLNDNIRAIAATYEATDTAPRTVFKTFDQSIKKDDFILVPTDTRHKMTVCKVVDDNVEIDLETSTHIAWVIGVVDTAEFKRMTQMEETAIETIKSAEKNRRREELRKSLMADSEIKLKALPISSVVDSGDTPAT